MTPYDILFYLYALKQLLFNLHCIYGIYAIKEHFDYHLFVITEECRNV